MLFSKVCLDNFFLSILSHIKGVSPRFLCNYLIFCLVLLAQITSRGDVFICILIGIFGAKSASLRDSKFPNFGQNGGHIGLLLAQIWNMQMSYVTSRACADSSGSAFA